MKFKFILIVSSFIIFLLLISMYTVDETEQVVITRFEKVNRIIKDPGLNFKLPIIEKIIIFPKNLQEWDGDPGQVPTKDKTYIWIDTFARWRIVDPATFLKTIKNLSFAKQRLDEIIDPAVRNFITSNRLIETVRNSNRQLDALDETLENTQYKTNFEISIGRDKINSDILNQAKPKLKEFGIELVDVKFKRINYVEEVRDSVYKRMIAERKQIAEKFKRQYKTDKITEIKIKPRDTLGSYQTTAEAEVLVPKVNCRRI